MTIKYRSSDVVAPGLLDKINSVWTAVKQLDAGQMILVQVLPALPFYNVLVPLIQHIQSRFK